jgi:hypothetical protein
MTTNPARLSQLRKMEERRGVFGGVVDSEFIWFFRVLPPILAQIGGMRVF